jgi:hypothetical protein
MTKKSSLPPEFAPLQLNGRLHPEWKRFFEQFLTMAETQSDASADPVPKADFDALIDKLQAANLME